jgi:hypothetical protein
MATGKDGVDARLHLQHAKKTRNLRHEGTIKTRLGSFSVSSYQERPAGISRSGSA